MATREPSKTLNRIVTGLLELSDLVVVRKQERERWATYDRVVATMVMIGTLVQAIAVVVGLIYAYETLQEGNRIAWRTYLDTRESETGRYILDKEPLRCVYRYGLSSIDRDCPAKVYANLSQAVEFTSQEISHLIEVKDYADSVDPGYYHEWCADTAKALGDDPSGVVSFVLWRYFDCKSETNCRVASDIGICISDEQFNVDEGRCFANLVAKRNRFLKSVNEPIPK